MEILLILIQITEILLMSNYLQQKTEKLFQEAIAITAQYPVLRGLQRRIEGCKHQLEQPMRVAIVGKIKAGKSTLMNALLGEILVATGTVEATFNVNWLKYGNDTLVVIHFKDKRPPEKRTVEELDLLTRRATENLNFLLSIEYIEVSYPNSILQSLNLIDTPGLASFYKDDEENTRKFLQLYGDSITAKTQKQAAGADAVLYLFRQLSGQTDKEVMEEFQGEALGRTTPINAIGVMTRIDDYYPSESEPLIKGQEIADRYMRDHPQLRCLFYTICPVSGGLALGAQTLTDEEWNVLQKLSTLTEQTFNNLTRNPLRYPKKEYPDKPEIPSTKERVLVSDRLGMYGVALSYQLIHSQTVTTKQELIEAILAKSGLPELRQLIISHFGDRAFLIKLNSCLHQIKKILFDAKQKHTGQEQKVIQDLNYAFDKLEAGEIFFHQFKELEILRSYYENKLTFTEEELQQLLQIVGEKGKSPAFRLGLPSEATMAQMLDEAKRKWQYWLVKANDIIAYNPESHKAINTIIHSYERIIFHLKQADKHLNIEETITDKGILLVEQFSKYQDIPKLSDLGIQLHYLIKCTSDPRKLLIEFNKIFKEAKKICYSESSSNNNLLLAKFKDIVITIEKIEGSEYCLKELEIWQQYEAGKLNFNQEEIKQMLEAIGEKGLSLAERLGLTGNTSLSKMLVRVNQRINYWSIRSNEPLIDNFATSKAARIILQTYERLRYNLEQANTHLNVYNDKLMYPSTPD